MEANSGPGIQKTNRSFSSPRDGGGGIGSTSPWDPQGPGSGFLAFTKSHVIVGGPGREQHRLWLSEQKCESQDRGGDSLGVFGLCQMSPEGASGTFQTSRRAVTRGLLRGGGR